MTTVNSIIKTPFFESIDKMFAETLSEVPISVSGNYKFSKDIITGEQGQDFIKNFLVSKGFVFISKNNDYRYDLLMSYNGNNITYEVKTDVYKDTGNLAVEFECRGKASGIDITESDYFVTYFHKTREIWNIKTSDLKKLIKENNFRKTEGSGDKDSNTKLYLITKKDFSKYFKVYKLS